MCLLSFENTRKNSPAFLAGLERFTCGGCPECLQKKSSYWALRATMQVRETPAVMVTLTYDTYKYNQNGDIIGENVDERELSKKDCQKFIKRLRRYFEYHIDIHDIKYIMAAEHGKRTNRSHYHGILFNVQFDDLVFYKKSKRGNRIYKSRTLDKIWGKGICTVDSVNVTSAIARYCTKYCSKDYGIDDTFMLFSHGIGENMLRMLFNGRSYMIEGREYSVPKSVWNWYLLNKYQDNRLAPFNKVSSVLYRPPSVRNRELNCSKIIRIPFYSMSDYLQDIVAERNAQRRELFRSIRDNDTVYKRYLQYWLRKNELYEVDKKPDFDRILALDDKKYHFYKTTAISCYLARVKRCTEVGISVPRCNYKITKTFAPPLSRLKGANDTKKSALVLFELHNITENPFDWRFNINDYGQFTFF